jgi:hypothetical protein
MSRSPRRSAVWLRVALAALTLVAAAPRPSAAQFERASVSGTVTDQQGGVVPGVTVTALRVQTQQSQTAVTDASGYYTLPSLMPGQYDISVELDGFKKTTRTAVQLDAAASVTLAFTLEPGALTEVVTVTSEAPPLQTDVTVRKTVEAKDLEQLSFSGRNPLGVPALKAGVIGGNFNNLGFAAFSNGGFNINGGRSDENNITVDGAVAIRTRSAGTIIGIQNVDTLQEVQVLTANYMPEYGRASGGQIRFVTKSGSQNYTGSASFFLRDESLQANSWTRNRSPNPVENSGPAPFDYKQYGYAFGGPIPGSRVKDKLFFYGAQEWVNFFQLETRGATVPTEAMRRGDFSELLNPNNGFYPNARVINDPLTGQPFPNNVIPANRLSPNGVAILNLYPLPTPGFRQGTQNLLQTSDNTQDQRKDSIRLDYRLNPSNQLTYRFSRSSFTGLNPYGGDFPLARQIIDRPNFTSTASWTSTLKSNLINETSYTFSRDDVFIDVYTETGLYQRSRTGINYPYIFPGNKEIEDKIPTVTGFGSFNGLDGGPYPASSSGPIHTVSNVTTLVQGRHTFKAGVTVEYSGQDDFDQINVSAIPGSTNNQNGRFEFADGRAGGTGNALANAALGLFNNYAELGQRNFTKWRSLATDLFVQDSWKPNSSMTIEGGFRYAYWPPWYSTTNNIANFDPRFYDAANAAVIDRSTGRLVSGPRYNGIILPGDGFENEGNDLDVAQNPAVQALFRGEPRGFSQTHGNVFEPRLGLSYQFSEQTVLRASAGVFHNRVTLNDSTLLGGNPPFQPQVTVSNGSVDNPGGAGGNAAATLPFGINGQDTVFKHPTAYTWSVGIQRELPFGIVGDITYVGRRGLYLQRERNINQLPLGTLQRPENAGANIAFLRQFKGYNVIRLSENAGNSKYHSLQLSADRRYSNGLKVGVAYTLGESFDNGSNKRDVLFNTYDDTAYWGHSSFDRRHTLVIHYIYDLPFFRDQTQGLMSNLLGGWQISGSTFLRSGTPFSVFQTANDIAGVGDQGFGQPYDLVGDPGDMNYELYTGPGTEAFNTAAFARPANGTFGNAPRNEWYNPGEQQWDLAIFKHFSMGGMRRIQFRAEMFNFLNHPNLGSIHTNSTQGHNYADPNNANFGRITSKSGSRDIQLSLRFLF